MSVGTDNISTGFVKNFHPNLLLDKALAKEAQRIKPVENRKEEVEVKVETVEQIVGHLEAVKGVTDELDSRNFWGKKKFISSNEAVLTGTASNAAEPGQHYIRVDKIALSHQISSQSFKSKDVIVAPGDFKIKIGDTVEQIVTIGAETTLEEFVTSINASDATIKASIIKTNESEKPYQIVLSSEVLGEKGKINLTSNLKAAGENQVLPNFFSSITSPSEWKYNRVEKEAEAINEEAVSNSLPKVLQKARGADYNLLFTVVNTGRVGESDNLEIRWVDQENEANKGSFKLDKFNYSAGKPVKLSNGLVLEFTPGDLVIHDTFSISSEQPAKITPWSKKLEEPGSPKIAGVFTGEDDVEYTMRILQGGIIGKSESVIVEYLIDDEPVGQIDLGKNYVPGTKVDIGNGLDLTIENGILKSGYETTFEVESKVSRTQWWRFAKIGDDDRPPEISMDIKWTEPEEPSQVGYSDIYKERSTAGKKIVGEYTGNFDNTYTFTVEGEGTVGTTDDLRLNWKDALGNEGVFKVGSDYVPGAVLEIGDGLSLIMEDGLLYESDYFTVEAFSPVVRAAQDAEIRLGASRDDDGVLIKHSSNELKDVIKGVTLNLQAPSEETIVVTIENDIESIVNQIKSFVENANTTLAFLKESTKYDREANVAAPLQAESSVINVYRTIVDQLIDPVTGLPVGENTLNAFGITMNQQGQLELDEQKLNQFLVEDYNSVANIFRSYGDSSNDAITYIGSEDATQISGLEGYNVTITKAATEGRFESNAVNGAVTVNQSNNKFRVIVNERESEDIEIEPGNYSLDDFREKLQIELDKDPIIGKIDFVTLVQDNKLVIKSGRFGDLSSIRIDHQSPQRISALNGNVTQGVDAEGNIDGIELQGSGRLLIAPKDTQYDGLRLYSNVSQAQINRQENTAKFIFTKGIAQKISSFVDNQLKEKTGSVDILSTGYKDSVKNLEDQIKRFNTRVDSKREFLTAKLARTEAKLGALQEEGRYINAQIAQI